MFINSQRTSTGQHTTPADNAVKRFGDPQRRGGGILRGAQRDPVSAFLWEPPRLFSSAAHAARHSRIICRWCISSLHNCVLNEKVKRRMLTDS